MSRKYQPKTKEYAQVSVVSSDQIYDKAGNIKNGVDIVGKIDRDLPNIVTTVKRRNGKTKFVEDTCNLTKKIKGEIVDFFKNNKTVKGNRREKAYLIKTSREPRKNRPGKASKR